MLRMKYVSVFLIGVGLCGPSLAFERFETGQTVLVACQNVNIMQAADSFSPVVGALKFGDKITIAKLHASFELPDSDFSSKAQLEVQAKAAAGDGEPEPVKPASYTRSAWIEMAANQFVSAACLVSDENFADQTMERAEEKVASLSSGKAKRNFSEDEDGDMRAMRGAAGKAKGGKANFELIDDLIVNAQGRMNLSDLKAFRQSGRLGEFK